MMRHLTGAKNGQTSDDNALLVRLASRVLESPGHFLGTKRLLLTEDPSHACGTES